jgi:hypothetical protein
MFFSMSKWLPASLAIVLATQSGCVRRTYNATPKIVSGALVEENDPVYTSTVSLDREGKAFCTGFVLDKRTIVTAAHCVANITQYASFSVAFGSKNRTLQKIFALTGKHALAHPGWDKADLGRVDIDPLPQQPKNDVGIIVLDEDAPEWVKPLPIKEIGDISVGRDVIVAGYGLTNPLPQDVATTEPRGFLRKTQGKLSAVNDAGKELIWDAPQDNPRASSCHGDSGGPMFYVEDNGSLTVIGVTSRSYSLKTDCSQKGVYTDVRKHTEWIKTHKEKIASSLINPGDWHHRYFTSKEGIKIALDFRLKDFGTEYVSTEVWLNVSHPSFTGTEIMTATLSSYINSLTQENLKLQFAGDGRFTAKFEKFSDEKVCAIASRWGIKQDVAVQINGKALANQNSGSEAFEFKFCE